MNTCSWPISGISQALRQERLGMFEEPNGSWRGVRSGPGQACIGLVSNEGSHWGSGQVHDRGLLAAIWRWTMGGGLGRPEFDPSQIQALGDRSVTPKGVHVGPAAPKAHPLVPNTGSGEGGRKWWGEKNLNVGTTRSCWSMVCIRPRWTQAWRPHPWERVRASVLFGHVQTEHAVC